MLTCKKRCYHGADIQTKNYKWEFPVEAENFYMTVNGHTCHHQHTTEKTQRKKPHAMRMRFFKVQATFGNYLWFPKKSTKKFQRKFVTI